MRTYAVPTLSLAGTGITTSYQFGAAIGAGRASRIAAEIAATVIAGTNATAVHGKLQASVDGSTWIDLSTLATTAASGGSPTVDQSVSVSGAGVYALEFAIPSGFAWVRLGACFVGGAGKIGESIAGTVTLS